MKMRGKKARRIAELERELAEYDKIVIRIYDPTGSRLVAVSLTDLYRIIIYGGDPYYERSMIYIDSTYGVPRPESFDITVLKVPTERYTVSTENPGTIVR